MILEKERERERESRERAGREQGESRERAGREQGESREGTESRREMRRLSYTAGSSHSPATACGAPALGPPHGPGAGEQKLVGKGQIGSALVGSLQISCFWTEGAFGYSS